MMTVKTITSSLLVHDLSAKAEPLNGLLIDGEERRRRSVAGIGRKIAGNRSDKTLAILFSQTEVAQFSDDANVFHQLQKPGAAFLRIV
jgi:hypothetical protein